MSKITSFTIKDVLFFHTVILMISQEESFDGVLNQGNLEMALDAPTLKDL